MEENTKERFYNTPEEMGKNAEIFSSAVRTLFKHFEEIERHSRLEKKGRDRQRKNFYTKLIAELNGKFSVHDKKNFILKQIEINNRKLIELLFPKPIYYLYSIKNHSFSVNKNSQK